jgi:mannose-6-phosphate isomerase-like protein (cupin superfamily)
MRKPFKKNLSQIPVEHAHGGSGSRQLILSEADDVSTQFSAMTKGFLKSGSAYDWHSHENIDEFFLVLQGSGVISFKDLDSMEYAVGDLIYIPANLAHKIEARGDIESQYYFIRLNK